MSKAGKRGKSAQGAAGPAKWEQALLAAPFEEVMRYPYNHNNNLFYRFNFSCTVPVFTCTPQL